RPEVTATVGTRPPGGLGVDAMLDFSVDVTLDGQRLTPTELRALMKSADGLVPIRGRWVELDRERLQLVLAHWRAVERAAGSDGMSFLDGMLLLVPASLLANWQSEMARFAPSLRVVVAHPSAMSRAELARPELGDTDVVLTSYGTVARLEWIAATPWSLVVLDEAQNIKNPGARQTRAVKTLRGRSRLALTGTPVENRLSDLWSLFDFLNPGLLGSARAFTSFTKALARRREEPYAPLRRLVQPYLLRRRKNDPNGIAA